MRFAELLADAPPLVFGDGSGAVTVQPVALRVDDDSYRLRVEVDLDTYTAIESAGLFHLTPAGRGEQALGFEPVGPIQIELGADAAIADDLFALGDDAELVVQALARAADGDGGPPLLSAELWYAISVTTEVPTPDLEGTLREGYRTLWAPGATANGSRLLGVVARRLARDGIVVDNLPSAPGLAWETMGASRQWRTVAMADDASGRAAVYAMLPFHVDADRYGEVALLLAYLNAGRIIGNWELDVDSGEIIVKTSIDVGGEPLTDGLVERLLDTNVQTVDASFELVERLVDGGVAIDDAIQTLLS